MKNTALKTLLTATILIPVAIYAQPRPGNPTTAAVITKAEIDKISATEQSQRTRDENARVVDIGDGPKPSRVENEWQIRRRMQFRGPLLMTIRPKVITSSPAVARRSLMAMSSTAGKAQPTPTADRTVRAAAAWRLAHAKSS